MNPKNTMLVLGNLATTIGPTRSCTSKLARCNTSQLLCRFINMGKLSNKRITRLESDMELGDCDQFKGRLINRNPRNLEQLAFEAKPKGFWLEKTANHDWNKLVLEQTGRQLVAYLQHWSGRRLIEASTKEAKLQKYFFNPNTVQAATVIAKVIARRCLQSGYICAGHDDYEVGGSSGQKAKTFYETVEASGLSLNEFPQIHTREVSDL